MATILFGGGDGGGIIIGPHGVRRIPPFDPPFLHQLKALNSLIRIHGVDGGLGRELNAVTTKLTDHMLARLDNVSGPVSGQNSVVFLDADDGFVCGSTGKPPIPFPHRLLGALSGLGAAIEAPVAK